MTLGKVLLVCEAFSHLKRRRKEKTPAKSWPKRCCHGEILFVCVTVVTIYGFNSVLSKVHGGKISSSSFMDVISYFSCRFQLLVLKNGKLSNKVGNEKASHLFCWYEEVISHRYLVVEI